MVLRERVSTTLTRRPWVLPAAVIVLAGLAAYWNSFQGAFVFDDDDAVLGNPSIRSLWPIWGALSTPRGGSPIDGRPVVNLSLAVNYAFGGTNPWGYHAVNLAFHILAGLTLFGVVRRTLLLPGLRERFAGRATALALAAALLWLVHPLQTESVTYVCQRAESMAGLLCLATLYCCIRAFEAERGIAWAVAGVATCLVGMGTKETLVAAPLLVLLYDRTFVSRSFREALRRHAVLYLALAATWGLLAALVLQAKSRGGTAGFGQGIGPWSYAQTQFGAIVHYLRLCFWPDPLVLDYGTGLAKGAAAVVPYAVVVGLLLAGTALALRYLPWAGFLGAMFFMILAPSSSVVPVVTQTMAEHRMYLPLAAVVVMAVIVADLVWASWLSPRSPAGRPQSAVRWAIPLAMVGALVAVEIYLTAVRNRDYRSDVSVWTDTARKAPYNARAYNNLGVPLFSRGRLDEAIANYRQALKLDPDYTEAHINLGCALAGQGRLDEAISHYQQVLKLKPSSAEAHNNLGNALASQGRIGEASAHFAEALRLKPNYPEAYNNLGSTLASQGRGAEAMAHYQEALRLRPDFPEALNNMGNALAPQGRIGEAIEHYKRAMQLNPNYADPYVNLANALASQGRDTEAIPLYRQALRLQPDSAKTYNNLAATLFTLGHVDEAIAHYRRAVELQPDYARAHSNLGDALATRGLIDEAIGHYEQALRLRPDLASARDGLSRALKLRQTSPQPASNK